MGATTLLDTNILIYIDKGIVDESVASVLRELTANGVAVSVVGLTLITRNSRDFSAIAELPLLDPFVK